MATNLTAARRTIRALRKAGRLGDEQAAMVQATESLARAVDVTPDDAQLWGKYLAALKALQELDGTPDDDDDFLRPQVGDPANT